MSTAQHTPGPWAYENGVIIQKDGGDFGYQIATIDHEFSDFPKAVIDANGHLIAAAPDLLEALQNAVGVLQAFATTSQTAALIERECRAAVAKATGAAAGAVICTAIFNGWRSWE